METYWEGLHPRLDPEDANDPTMRVNILAILAAPDVLATVRVAPLCRLANGRAVLLSGRGSGARRIRGQRWRNLDGDDRGRRDGL